MTQKYQKIPIKILKYTLSHNSYQSTNSLITKFVSQKYVLEADDKYGSESAKVCHLLGVAMRNYYFEENNLNERKIFLNEKGKPLHDECSFNISHSRDLVVGAFALKPDINIDTAIGLDILKIPTNDIKIYNSVIQKKFTKNEQISVSKNLKNFLKIWTAKEAYLKYLGQGIGFGLSRIEVEPDRSRLSVDGLEVDERIHVKYLDVFQDTTNGELNYCCLVCDFDNCIEIVDFGIK